MFAGNEKISPHQVRCLMFTDWIAKLLLLLPRAPGAAGGWNDIAALILGGVGTLLYLWMLAALLPHVTENFTGFVQARLGKYPARLSGILFLAYLLLDQVYLARLAAVICRAFLLPETSETLIAVCVLLAGAATASGSSQKRGRAAECLAVLVAAALALMLAASLPSVHLSNYRLPDEFAGYRVMGRGGAAFAGFAGAALLFYEAPHISWKPKKHKKTLLGGFLWTFLFLLVSFVILLGTFGEESLLRLPWPILTLMSSVNLPGGFLQRWDAVFLAVLLFSLLTASGTCSHYMKRITGELLPKKTPEKRLWCLFLATLVLTLLVRDFETATSLFIRWGLCFIMPLTVLLTILLYILERRKKKCES